MTVIVAEQRSIRFDWIRFNQSTSHRRRAAQCQIYTLFIGNKHQIGLDSISAPVIVAEQREVAYEIARFEAAVVDRQIAGITRRNHKSQVGRSNQSYIIYSRTMLAAIAADLEQSLTPQPTFSPSE